MPQDLDLDVVLASQRALTVIFIIAILTANAFLLFRLLRSAGTRLFEMPPLYILAALAIGDILLPLFSLVVHARRVYEDYEPPCRITQLANVYSPFNNFVFSLGLIFLVVEILLRKVLSQNSRVLTSLVCGGVPYLAGLVTILPLHLAKLNWDECLYMVSGSGYETIRRRFQAVDVLSYLLSPILAFSASLLLMVFKGGRRDFALFKQNSKPDIRNGIVLSTWDPQSGHRYVSQGAQPLLPQNQPYACPSYPGQPLYASGQTYPTQPNPQISQSNPQTAKNTPQSVQPTPQTAQANPQTAQANPQTAQANLESAQANPQTAQPSPQTAQINPQTAQTNPQTAQPSPQTAQTNPQTVQPNLGSAQSTAQTYIPEPRTLNQNEVQLSSRRERLTLALASFITVVMAFPMFIWLIAYVHSNDRIDIDPVPRMVLLQFCVWFSFLRPVVTPFIFGCRIEQPSA